jgi:DNA-binding ferritin-like protein (Dps family)
MKKEEEIDNKIRAEIQNGDTENLEEMAQRIKDEDIEPLKDNLKGKILEILLGMMSKEINGQILNNTIKQILELFEEEHKAIDGYCCACGYDIAGFKERLREERQKWIEERKKEPFRVKEDKGFTYYHCCGQIIGIGRKMPKGLKISEIKCGKCGRRIY